MLTTRTVRREHPICRREDPPPASCRVLLSGFYSTMICLRERSSALTEVRRDCSTHSHLMLGKIRASSARRDRNGSDGTQAHPYCVQFARSSYLPPVYFSREIWAMINLNQRFQALMWLHVVGVPIREEDSTVFIRSQVERRHGSGYWE